MAISDWVEEARPREKLLQRGANALSDSELLAIFLRTGVKGKSAIELAADLLSQSGGLVQLFEKPQHEFCQLKGLGPAKYAQLKAVLELSQRFYEQAMQGQSVFNHPDAVKHYAALQLKALNNEVFALLMLNNQNQLIAFHKLFYGTVNASSVYPREIIKCCLSHNAAKVIFVHNHPSGSSIISGSDKSITDKMKTLLAEMDIDLVDHIIVADDVVSFAEKNLI